MKEKLILLIEDSSDDVMLTLRAFKTNNIAGEIVIACDGVEALDYLFAAGAHAGRDTSIMPHIVLLDLKLPRIDGFEVLKRIRTDVRTRLLPVVILTSSREERDVLDGYRLGGNSYIRKPVDFAQFSEAVKQIGIYWLALNESPSAHA